MVHVILFTLDTIIRYKLYSYTYYNIITNKIKIKSNNIHNSFSGILI